MPGQVTRKIIVLAPVASTAPGQDGQPASPASLEEQLAQMKAQTESLNKFLRDGDRRHLLPGPPMPAEQQFDEYLRPNNFIQSDDPSIKAIAGVCLPGSEDDLRTAADMEWMISGMLKKSYKQPYLSAVETLLAKEGVTANAIAPALIATEMVSSNPRARPDLLPVGRFGAVEEVAGIAVLLARNGYITGQTYNVNGGWYMS